MTSRKELLEREERAWRALCGLYDRTPEDAWEKPGANGDWSMKDVMAHVAAWHALTTDRLECLRSTGDLPGAPDVDSFNDEQHLRCKDMPLHDIRAMSGGSRHRFREEVAQIEDPVGDRLAQIVVANGDGHYAEHLPDLEAFLKEIGA